MRRFIICLIALRFPLSAAAAPDVSEFAQSPEWLKLLHYYKNFGSYKGLIHTQDFYISPDGRYNPEAELKAEIAEFATGESKCRFPARFNLLKDNGFVSGDLADCKEYQEFIKDVQPNGVTLLFTDAYMNNPASMFGHTLVRIDTARKGTQMLAHGSNFGVTSGADTGLAFILKGLFGGYDGKYSFNPYWTIINTYNNIENRDIWEYGINLTAEEQLKFVNHLYEMQEARIQYFFLTKNCSYMILELLEAVRPSLDLSSNYNYYAIPMDTLKTVRDVPELVGDINYRPARYTKIKYQLKQMSSEQYAAFRKGIKEHDYKMPNLSETEQRQVLDTLYQYYQYRYTKGEMELKEYRQNSFAVLRKRSALSAAEELKPEGYDPSLSHGSAQVSFSGGVYNHKSFEQVTIRPAYTSLTDNNEGLIRGAGVRVTEIIGRYYNQNHKLVLQRFTGLAIYSLMPMDRVFMPYSYKTDFSLVREFNPQNEKEGTVGNIEFGIGKTLGLTERFWLYGMIDVHGQYGGLIPNNYWVGAAPEIGMYADFSPVRIHLAAEQTFATAKFGNRLQYKADVALGITRDLSLNFEFNASHNKRGHNQQEWLTAVKYSF